MLLAVADVVWQALIAGAVTVALAWMTHRAAEKAAKKVQEVKTTLETSTTGFNDRLDSIAVVGEEAKAIGEKAAATGEKVHVLVNNAMGIQLKSNAVLARRMASMTKEQADMDAAKAAEDLYAEHMVKQAKVDAKGGGK